VATLEYQSEQNVIRNFIDLMCIEKSDASSGAMELFKAFDEWRRLEGHRKITQTKFGRMLSDFGYQKVRNSAGRMIYTGIGLNIDTNYSDYSEKNANYSERIFQ